jgi:hypothetical protein
MTTKTKVLVKKKVMKKATKKVAKKVTNNVTLTQKQAESLQAFAVKNKKTFKFLDNKINALNA